MPDPKGIFINCLECGLRNLKDDPTCGGCGATLKKSAEKPQIESRPFHKYNLIVIGVASIITMFIFYKLFITSESDGKKETHTYQSADVNVSENTGMGIQENVVAPPAIENEDLLKIAELFLSIDKIEFNPINMTENFNYSFKRFINGNNNQFEAYDLAVSAAESVRNARHHFSNIKLPQMSDDEYNEDLTNIINYFIIAYSYKEEAFKNAQEYINSGEIKYLSGYIKNTDNASETMKLTAQYMYLLKNKIKENS